MTIKGDWNEPCPNCGALDGCCETGKARLETATTLAGIVKRQGETITRLQHEIEELQQDISDLDGSPPLWLEAATLRLAAE